MLLFYPFFSLDIITLDSNLSGQIGIHELLISMFVCSLNVTPLHYDQAIEFLLHMYVFAKANRFLYYVIDLLCLLTVTLLIVIEFL